MNKLTNSCKFLICFIICFACQHTPEDSQKKKTNSSLTLKDREAKKEQIDSISKSIKMCGTDLIFLAYRHDVGIFLNDSIYLYNYPLNAKDFDGNTFTFKYLTYEVNITESTPTEYVPKTAEVKIHGLLTKDTISYKAIMPIDFSLPIGGGTANRMEEFPIYYSTNKDFNFR